MPRTSIISLLLLTIFYLPVESISTVVMQTLTNTITIFDNNQFASNFLRTDQNFECSINELYTYQQTQDQLNSNFVYQLVLTGITSTTSVSISTAYNTFTPTINTTSCPQTSSTCTINVKNNCPNPVGYFSYFDIVNVNIQGLQLISYYVICNASFTINTFQAGLFMLLFLFEIVIIFGAIYSKAWSYGGYGFNIDFRWIIPFNIFLIVGGIITLLAGYALSTIGTILAWILGMVGVTICFTEFLFMFRI